MQSLSDVATGDMARNYFALQKTGVTKAPQFFAIARDTITNVCLVGTSDIKFVQRAR
jgi:hypothetical protein